MTCINAGSGVDQGTGSQRDDYPDTGEGSVTEADAGSLSGTGMGQVIGWERRLRHR